MHPSNSCKLLLFLRYPKTGCTKTRLIPALGAAGAANLQRQMANYIVQRLQHPNWELQVHFAGASLVEMQVLLGAELTYRAQADGELGDRLWHGFQQSCQQGYQQGHEESRIIAIGADCPDVSPQHIQQAFNALQNRDVVLGPASDGGYYLIGLRQPYCPHLGISAKALFQDIDWSTHRVLHQTLSKVQQLSLSWSVLETLSDIDRPEDLVIWEQRQQLQPLSQPIR